MIYSEGEKDIDIKEGPIEANIEFDSKFLNKTEFDETWMTGDSDMY